MASWIFQDCHSHSSATRKKNTFLVKKFLRQFFWITNKAQNDVEEFPWSNNTHSRRKRFDVVLWTKLKRAEAFKLFLDFNEEYSLGRWCFVAQRWWRTKKEWRKQIFSSSAFKFVTTKSFFNFFLFGVGEMFFKNSEKENAFTIAFVKAFVFWCLLN